MLNIEKHYIAPKVGLVRLQLEGLMAEDSCYPSIKVGSLEYEEFEDYTNLNGEDLLLF
jgi:hypothetical protein